MNEDDRQVLTNYDEGRRDLGMMIAVDLDEISDDDGSLSGGDCVEYIYQVLEGLGVVEACGNGHAIPTGAKCRFCDDDEVEFTVNSGGLGVTFGDDYVTGPRDQLLLLARTIHDTLEGEDQP